MADLDLRIQATDSFTPTFSAFNRALSGIGNAATAPIRALGGIVDTLGKVGLAANGIRDIASSLGAVFNGPIQGASDVNEAMNKVQVVFGASAASVTDFAKTAATGLGQSQATALGALGTFGNLFVSMGMTTDAAAGMSKETVQLASDLASFNNIRPEEALEKLRAGLVGEAEPLRALGVNLSAAAIEAKALETNVGKTKDELTAADKATASFALILEQTKTAQGDFARTSTGFANAQRVIAAQFDDLKASMGQAFLPTMEKVVGVFSTMLPGAMAMVSGPIDEAGQAFADIGQEVLTFIKTVQNIADVEGVSFFTAALTALELRIGEVFGTTAQDVFHGFMDLVSDLTDTAGDLWDAFKEVAGFFAGELLAAFGSSNTSGRTFGETLTMIGQEVKATTKEFTTWVKQINDATPQGELMRKVVEGLIVAFVTWKAATISTALAVEAYTLAVALGTAAKGAWTVATTAASIVSGAFSAVLGVAASAFRVLNLVIMANPIGALVAVLALAVAGLVYAYENSETFRQVVDAAFKAVSEAVTGAMATAIKWIDEFVAWVGDAPAKVAASALGIGAAIVDGIVGGITSFRGKVKGVIEDLAGSLPEWVKKILGIASPSTVFAGIGEDIVDGLTEGIDSAASNATAAVEDLATAIGAAVPRVLTATEQEVAKYQERIGDANRKYERSEADALAKHLEKLHDLEVDLGKAKKDAKAGILEKIADENVSWQRRERDEAAKHAQALEDIEATHGETMVAIEQRMAEQRGAALADLMQGLADVEANTGRALDAIGERTGQRINEAIASAGAAIADVSARAAEQIASATDALDMNRAIRARRDEFGAGQSAEALTRTRAREDADLAAKGGDSAASLAERQAKDVAALARRAANDKAALDAKVVQDASSLKAKRDRDDADASFKLAQDLRYAKDDDERTRLRVAYGRMVEDRTRSRALDDQTLKASVDASRKALDDKQRLDREALADKEREEVAALAAQTARDVAALAARRAREDEDRAFRQAQQVAAQEFSDGLENEALARQITRIQDDTRTRIEGINIALTDKQKQITEDAATEARKVGESAQERIGILKDKFFDKVGPLADDAKNKINSYIDDVQKRVGELQAAAVAAAAAVASVGGGGSDNGVASGLSNALTSLVTTTRNAGSFDRGVNGRGGYASGGRSIPGGLSLVGEQGPELVRLPGGSDVFSNADTGRMLGGGNNDDNRPVNIILDGATIARSTWKHLKRLNLSGATLGLT